MSYSTTQLSPMKMDASSRRSVSVCAEDVLSKTLRAVEMARAMREKMVGATPTGSLNKAENPSKPALIGTLESVEANVAEIATIIEHMLKELGA